MWLLKLTTLLASIQFIKAAKNLALEELHDELARIQKRANEYRLETDVHSDHSSPIQVHDWILERSTKFMDLQGAYEKLDLSEGFPGQTELLNLYDEEMESGYSDDIGEKVLEGFKELDGFEYLSERVVALDVDEIKKKLEKSEEKRHSIKDYDQDNLRTYIDIVSSHVDMIPSDIEQFSRKYPEISKLTDQEKKECEFDLKQLQYLFQAVVSFANRARKILEGAGYLDTEGVLNPFIEVKEVTDDVISKMDRFKKWEELSSNLGKVVEAINRLKKLELMIPNVKRVFNYVKKDFYHFKNYEISEKVYKRYQDIESLKPLLQKIRSLTSFMNKLEPRVERLLQNSKPVEEYFGKLDISDDLSTEMFEGLETCLKMFDSSIEVSRKELDSSDEPLGRIRSLAEELNTNFNILSKVQNHSQFSRLAELGKPMTLDDGIHEILESTIKPSKELYKWLNDRKNYHGSNSAIFENTAKQIKDLMREVDFNEMESFAETSTQQLDNIKEVLVCYGDLNVESSNVETLLNLMKDKWNFDPMDLERIVEVMEIFKDAYKRVKEVWDWKREGYDPNDYTPYNRFVLSEEDVKKITVVLDGFESIRNVEKRWDSLKDLDIQNEHWNNLNELVSSLLEHVSRLDSKMSLIDFFGLEPFQLNGYKDNIKNQVKKFIDEEYEGSRKSGILNLLEEIEQVIEKYPTVDMIKNMEEAVKEMKNWEMKKNSGNEEKDQTFIDCSMNPCDVIPKLPPVGPDAPVKNVEL